MKYLKWIALSTLALSSVSASAGNIPATTIIDNYIGAGYAGDVKNGDTNDNTNNTTSKYNINSLTVTRVDELLTVVIDTNFVGHNTGHIDFGDLFMSTNVSASDAPWKPSSGSDTFHNTDWNYAYTIRDWERQDGSQPESWVDRNNENSGRGQLVSGFTNSDLSYSNSTSNRHNQVVSLNSSTWGGDYQSSSYSYDKVYYNGSGHNPTAGTGYSDWTAGNNKLTFSFDVAGTALATANQIAFRWAMSCANDIIEGLVSIKDKPGSPGTSVPEPQTILLMLLGMAGIAYRRKTQA